MATTSPARKQTSPESRHLAVDAKAIDPKQIALTTWKQWWKVTVPVGLVLAAAAMVGVSFTVDPQYKATATVLVAERAPFFVFADIRERSSGRFVSTQQELLRSPLVIGPVVSRDEIAKLPEILELEDTVGELGRLVSFKSRGRSDLYDISYTGPNAENAAMIVNAIVDEFFNLRQEYDSEQMATMIGQLKAEGEDHAQKVRRLQDQVREMVKLHPETGKRLPKIDIVTDNAMVLLRSRLAEQEMSQAVLRAELETLKKLDQAYPIEIQEEEVDEALSIHGTVQALETQITEKQQRLRVITKALRNAENDPRHQRLTAEIAQDKELLAKTRDDLRGEIREKLLQTHKLSRRAEIQRKKTNLEGLKHHIVSLNSQLKEEVTRATKVNLGNLDLEFKRGELARAEMVFDLIAQRVEKMHTEQRAPEQIKRRMAATAPKQPVEKYPLKQMAVAGMGAFCLPLLITFGWEWRVQRLSSTDHVLTYSGVPVVGEIANFPTRTQSSNQVISRRTSRALRYFEESVHNLRTYLMLSEPLSNMKVLAITSSISQEGKTSIATQLAMSFSRAGGNVLLIDGDMRAPNIHSIFDIERGPGLVEVLDGKATLSEAIDRQWSDTLHILPAGQLSMDPHRLFSNNAMERLLDDVRDKYNLIIIDTPPVLAASEALVMARAADTSLLCAMRDRSRSTQLRSTHKRLVDAGAHPVGAVFSGVSTSKYYHTYGDYEYESDG